MRAGLHQRLMAIATGCVLLPVVCIAATTDTPAERVQVAVVGGLQASGVWPRLAGIAGTALGMDIQTVAASPKEGVVPAFRDNRAALLLIHASDEAAALEAAGYAVPLRTWAFNEHVVVGPEADPLKIRDTGSGVEAMRRIAAAKAPFIVLRDPGSYGIVQRLWRQGGVRPDPAWVLWDAGESRHAVLTEAGKRGAYAVVGAIPVATGKLAAPGVAVLLAGDPQMRRPYVVLTPGPRHPASTAERRAAERLADYLVSTAGQTALVDAARDDNGTWLFPRSAGGALLPAATTPRPAHARD